ncbi:MAG: cupin domain-containing protein [Clostridia bacterium]|nr:cupin domain-containing protein [Clostridia bacterium]
MSIYNQEIAERLHAIRELSEMSPEELAAAMNMAADEYLRYESGEVDIPISALYDVSNTLGVSITELLTGDRPRLHTYSLVRNGRGIQVERSEAYKYEDLAYKFAGKKVSPFQVHIAAGAEDEPYHLNVHSGQEYHYCLEGSYKIFIADKEITINQGDSLYFDSGNPHGMKAIGGTPARVLVVVI